MSMPMDDAELQQSLDELAANPRDMDLEVPPKYDASGALLKRPQTAFSAAEIRSGDYVLKRVSLRRTFHTIIDGVVVSLEDRAPGKAPIREIDRAEDLVDKLKYRHLEKMDQEGLRRAALSEAPWSGDYWAFYLGCLGRRYADRHFPRSYKWEKNYDYIRRHPAREIIASGSSSAMNLLSPSEKYDFLVGDERGRLTRAMWSAGKPFIDRKGKIERWMGICEGWAPASYMLSRPMHQAIVLAADGQTYLHFYPTDIKALASLLWANTNPATRFIGGRSDIKKPPADPRGRVLNRDSFDTNPGTFHLVLVNQIGVSNRSFVMDATYDYQVWNQPVYRYEYRYFNPQTLQLARTLKAATVPRDGFSRDRFRNYRSRDAAFYVGIIMHVVYIAETKPKRRTFDTPGHDEKNSVIYKYDLELDKNGKIIGGEWYTGRRHPDFLWTPPPGTRAVTTADAFATSSWSPNRPIPDSWRKAAWRASESSQPLAKIVEALIRLANS